MPDVILLQPPPRDPRDPVVRDSSSPAATASPEPPLELFPEAPALRLSLDYDPLTTEQMETLDASEALHRLCDRHGVARIFSMLKLIAIGKGEAL